MQNQSPKGSDEKKFKKKEKKGKVPQPTEGNNNKDKKTNAEVTKFVFDEDLAWKNLINQENEFVPPPGFK